MFNTKKLKGWALSACLLGLAASPAAWSADVIDFDADGPAAANGSMPVVAFDWAPSSNVLTAVPGDGPAFPLAPGQSTSVQMLSHGTLNGYADEFGDPAGAPVGLNSNFEVTFVVGVGVTVTNNAGILEFGPIDTDPKFKRFFEVWYDQGPSVKSNALSGLGFAGGTTLIMRGEIVDISNSPLPIGGSLIQFDNFGANDFPGVVTPNGSGGMQLTARVTEVNPSFFLNNSLPVGSTTLFFNQSLRNAFAQTNPSKSFVRAPVTEGHPTFTPVLGAVNGQSGPDFQQQVDANNSFTAPLCTSRIGDFVWNDLNNNGLQDGGEPGIDSVQLVLRNAATNALIATTTTSGGGLYLFSGLCAGDYTVTVTASTLPAGFTPTTSFAGDPQLDSNGSPALVNLPSNSEDLSIDFGYRQPPASLGDFVWDDFNRDGLQDNGEPGIDNVRVDLFACGDNPNGAPRDTTFTAGGGLYLFDNLAPGSYFVKFTLANGYVFSPMNAGNDAIDSDANTATGVTPCVSLAAGESNLTVDAGMNLPPQSQLGDYVWVDTNANGLQDDGDTGVPNVTVSLFNCDGTPVAGKPPVLTDGNGFYLFTGLSAGQYYVVFDLSTAASGYVFTKQNVGANDAIDSDANPATGKSEACVTLGVNDSNMTVDAGVFRPAALGDRVWEDLNTNGKQDGGESGISGVQVELFNCDGSAVTDIDGNPVLPTSTDASGLYHFTNLVPGSYKVKFTAPAGYVFSPQDNVPGDDVNDSDADSNGITDCVTLVSGETNNNVDAGLYVPATAQLGDYVWEDLNVDGVQNEAGTGVVSVTVKLYACGANPAGAPLASTQTDGTGHYLFTDLAAGSYFVVFDLSTAASGYAFTQQNIGDDALDSDANPATGVTSPCVTLAAGESNLTVDAGVYRLASLGDRVWNDLNRNGIQDAGEAGIANVTVNLRDCAGTFIASTSTNGSGIYGFTNLMPGQYMVEFINPDASVWSFSPRDAANDALDSDADPATGRTVCITLNSGQQDLTWDAGLYKAQPKITLKKLVSVKTDEQGNRVWEDANFPTGPIAMVCGYGTKYWSGDYYSGGYDKGGRDRDGYDRDGYNKDGYNKDGYHKMGYSSGARSGGFYKMGGASMSGYAVGGFYKTTGSYSGGSYSGSGSYSGGYDRDGYDRDGYDKDGYNKGGYDKDNYTKCIDYVYFKFEVTNTGDMALTNLVLTDVTSNAADVVDVSSCTLPSSLAVGASASCVVGPVKARTGQHTDTGKVTAKGGSITVEATDPANYYGKKCEYCSGNTSTHTDKDGSYKRCGGSYSGSTKSY